MLPFVPLKLRKLKAGLWLLQKPKDSASMVSQKLQCFYRNQSSLQEQNMNCGEKGVFPSVLVFKGEKKLHQMQRSDRSRGLWHDTSLIKDSRKTI